MDARQRSVALQHVEDVRGRRGAVNDLQAFLRANRVDQGVLAGVFGLGRRILRRRQPTERQRRRLPFAPQLASGIHGDAGRIQPAAQVYANSPCLAPAQPVAHDQGIEVAELLGVGVIRRGCRHRRLFRVPMPHDARSPPALRRPLDAQRVARRQLAHCGEERAGVVDGPSGQMAGHHCLVQRTRDTRDGEHRLDRAGENDALARQGVVEGPGADVISSAEQRAMAHVPQGEGVVAKQVARTVLAPAQPSANDQLCICQCAARHGNAQRIAKPVAVVQPRIRRQPNAGGPIDAQRRRLRFPAAEADFAFGTQRAGCSIAGKLRLHEAKRLRLSAVIPVADSADCSHGHRLQGWHPAFWR